MCWCSWNEVLKANENNPLVRYIGAMHLFCFQWNTMETLRNHFYNSIMYLFTGYSSNAFFGQTHQDQRRAYYMQREVWNKMYLEIMQLDDPLNCVLSITGIKQHRVTAPFKMFYRFYFCVYFMHAIISNTIWRILVSSFGGTLLF